MAVDRHEYGISLDLSMNQASRQTLKALNESLGESGDNVESLNKTYQQLSRNTENLEELQKLYSKAIDKAVKKKTEEIDKLEAQKVAIITNTDLTEEQIQAQLEEVDAKVKTLKKERELIKVQANANKKRLTLQEKLNKLLGKEGKLHPLGQIVKLQEKLNKLLGKESTLRKSISKVASVTAKGAGVALGAASAMVGGAISSAGSVYDREQAMKSLKSPATSEDVHEVYLNSGGRADYSTIIQSINKLSGKFSGEELRTHALLDVENPGWADTLLRSNAINTSAQEARRVLDQIKKYQGVESLSAAMESAAKSRAVTTGRVSQTDYIQAHTALAQAGFDDENIRHIISSVASKQGDFIENFNKTDFARFARGQGKNLVRASEIALQRTNLGAEVETPAQRAARETQRKVAEFSLKKDEIVTKILMSIHDSGILDTLEELAKKVFQPSVINGLVDFFTITVKGLSNLITLLTEKLQESGITKFGESLGEKVYEWTHPQKAQGGIVRTPSIVGEAGSELVLPLNNIPRANNIINNYNNTNNFTMSGNQTALSLSQSISNNRFIRHSSLI